MPTTDKLHPLPAAHSFQPTLPAPVHRSADGSKRSIFAALSGQPAAQAGDTPTDPHVELNKLLLNMRGGCKRSFDVFYDKTRARLMRSVQNIIRNRDDAADVLQDVYTKVWGRSAQFQDDKGHALNWALGIAHHTAVSSLRTKSARPQTVSLQSGHGNGNGDDDADPYAGLESPWLAPDELAIREQACRAVRQAVHGLPADHREALLLAFYDGLSYDEVAQRMCRPLGTVKSWIRRSLVAMQPAMGMHRDALRAAAPQPVRPSQPAPLPSPRRRAPAAHAMPAMA